MSKPRSILDGSDHTRTRPAQSTGRMFPSYTPPASSGMFAAYRPPPKPAPPPIPQPAPPLPAPTDPTILGYGQNGPVFSTVKDRAEHTLQLGKTGQGKSNGMRFYMRQDMEAGRGFVCLEPHGKLIDEVLSDVPVWRERDVIYLDASDEEWVFGLNLFQPPESDTAKARTTLADQVVQAYKKNWGGGWAQTTEEWLKVIALTFMDNQRGTMAMIPRLLTDAAFRATFLPAVTSPFARTRWETAVNSRSKEGELRYEEIRPTLARLNKFLMNPVIANIVGQEKTTLDFVSWMNTRKIVLVKLPDQGEEGIGEEAVELLGTLIMQLILRAAFSREVGSVLYPIYADEFQHYVTSDIPKIIQNVRKYGVGLFLATQSFANIPDEDIRDALLGVGTLICYQLTDRDARIVAGEFRHGVKLAEDWQPDRDGNVVYHRPAKMEVASRLASLKSIVGMGRVLVKSSSGEHVVWIPNMETTPVPWETANRDTIIAKSRERYCRRREEVEQEIRDLLMPAEEYEPESIETIAEAEPAQTKPKPKAATRAEQPIKRRAPRHEPS